jgi:DNA-binding response OmpR family regulator
MFEGCRILIVDDNQDSCEIMSLILKYSNHSYDISLAFSAQEALDLIGKNDFDLFVLDNRLPDSTGVELCRRIRENDKQTPVIFYSAIGGGVFEKAAKEAGADEYLVKPDDLDVFAETVRKNMKRCLADHRHSPLD